MGNACYLSVERERMIRSIGVKCVLLLTIVTMLSIVIDISPVSAEENIFNFVYRKFGENDTNIKSLQDKDLESERRITQLESDNSQLRADLKAQLQMIDALIARINKQDSK